MAVAQPADIELMEVRIGPAERRLDDPVQLAEMEAPRDDNLAPDCRLDVEHGDAELRGVDLFPGHVVIVTEKRAV